LTCSLLILFKLTFVPSLNSNKWVVDITYWTYLVLSEYVVGCIIIPSDWSKNPWNIEWYNNSFTFAFLVTFLIPPTLKSSSITCYFIACPLSVNNNEFVAHNSPDSLRLLFSSLIWWILAPKYAVDTLALLFPSTFLLTELISYSIKTLYAYT